MESRCLNFISFHKSIFWFLTLLIFFPKSFFIPFKLRSISNEGGTAIWCHGPCPTNPHYSLIPHTLTILSRQRVLLLKLLHKCKSTKLIPIHFTSPVQQNLLSLKSKTKNQKKTKTQKNTKNKAQKHKHIQLPISLPSNINHAFFNISKTTKLR